ncbi:epoxyqueuosine reductase QueH [bacterium]|nr:epoxyqueuosine reductase QueH [bacterium]
MNLEKETNKKILLHACCAICSGYPITLLKELGYNVIVYFCNNNFDTIDEYNRRLEAEKTLCKHFGVELLVEPYTPQIYIDYIKGLENEPEGGARCIKCFELRLKESAKKAKELGIDIFTTSMIISPHKNFKNLCGVGESVGKEYGLEFLGLDFKKKDGFLKTNKISKDLGLYRQNYCGCIFAKNKR